MDKGPQHTTMLARLAKNSPDDNLALRDHVTSLMQHPGWRIVQELVDAEMATVRHYLDWSGVREQSEYAAMHGRLRGLAQGRATAEAVLIAADLAEDELKAIAAQTAAEEI